MVGTREHIYDYENLYARVRRFSKTRSKEACRVVAWCSGGYWSRQRPQGRLERSVAPYALALLLQLTSLPCALLN